MLLLAFEADHVEVMANTLEVVVLIVAVPLPSIRVTATTGLVPDTEMPSSTVKLPVQVPEDPVVRIATHNSAFQTLLLTVAVPATPIDALLAPDVPPMRDLKVTVCPLIVLQIPQAVILYTAPAVASLAGMVYEAIIVSVVLVVIGPVATEGVAFLTAVPPLVSKS
jgi:hypothetical protein